MVGTDIVNPLLDAVKSGTVGDIIDNDCDGSISDVAGDEGPKSLLASSIPELESDGFLRQKNVLGNKVDADGWPLLKKTAT